MPYMASRRITLSLLLRYRRVMAYVASRRITLSCRRFFTLALTRKSHGLSDYWKSDVCTINVLVAVIVSSSCFSSDHHHYYDLDVRL